MSLRAMRSHGNTLRLCQPCCGPHSCRLTRDLGKRIGRNRADQGVRTHSARCRILGRADARAGFFPKRPCCPGALQPGALSRIEGRRCALSGRPIRTQLACKARAAVEGPLKPENLSFQACLSRACTRMACSCPLASIPFAFGFRIVMLTCAGLSAASSACARLMIRELSRVALLSRKILNNQKLIGLETTPSYRPW